MIIQKTSRHSVRINPDNPNHHLYLNNGTWWIHYTEHNHDYTVQRVRMSLNTQDVVEARLRRDLFLEGLVRGGRAA